MVNAERLAETFRSLAATGSVSRREGALAADLRRRLEVLGAEVWVDDTAAKTGSDTGNLFARLEGTSNGPALLLNAHMDTVQPGEGVSVQFGDGVFTSNGQTILGADDKSAIAVILEALNVLRERREVPHGPVEIVLTTCEEVGLAGARHLDFSRVTAPFGYTLDGSDTDGIIVQAPSANRFEIRVIGKDAHAGAHPEQGINAIHLAAKAMAELTIGRIDRETTCNIGRIEGGTATNIVPPLVTLQGEARSHDETKLENVTSGILAAFERIVAAEREGRSPDGLPRLETRVERSYSATRIPVEHPLVGLAQRAAQGLGRSLRTKISGGGSDANIFFEKGIPLGILGTGMREIHTVREHVRLDDMIRATELLLEIIRLHCFASGKKIHG
ncbi:MAG: M20/M25/M40 family metallo-hydrolase [Hyphomicrobiales bacterium]